MKENGNYPKCGNTDIRCPYRIQEQYHIKVDLPGIRTATFDRLTCAKCGYSKLYSDRIGLENIRSERRRYYTENTYKEKRIKMFFALIVITLNSMETLTNNLCIYQVVKSKQ